MYKTPEEHFELAAYAQQYGIKHRLTNVLSPGGLGTHIKPVFSPEYKQRYDHLVEVDTDVRAVLTDANL